MVGWLVGVGGFPGGPNKLRNGAVSWLEMGLRNWVWESVGGILDKKGLGDLHEEGSDEKGLRAGLKNVFGE